jgi:hypothetical protein
MDSQRVRGEGGAPGSRGERYREAATHALDQLEWCVEYLYRLGKPDIARALERNRRQILDRLRSPA